MLLAVLLAAQQSLILFPTPSRCLLRPIAYECRSAAPHLQLGGLGKGMGDFMKSFAGGDPSGLSDEEKTAMEDRFKRGAMSFQDFLTQVDIMQKAGSMQQMISRSPFGGGGGSGPSADQLAEGERKLKRYKKYVEAMIEEERNDPSLIITEVDEMRAGSSRNPERITRISEATGSSLDEVGQFVYEFKTLQAAAVKFSRGESPETIRKEMMEEKEKVVPKNRAQRRAAKRGKPGAVKGRAGGGGFGGR
eukprot:CAMPEP_0183359140 /NCGR_PEP_ID=MMETSP0164_2-20130417/51301_1 /TAXON_ID=221442 /ORGANISM="Coccolithus pelagicus ssp braarudi, Strain PLY182g" /LENGTH=247 /DNA_ID=CAMNT_0025533191 /DNA_START=42 /DNA_END=785 /DNA_ORIENTATION=+